MSYEENRRNAKKDILEIVKNTFRVSAEKAKQRIDTCDTSIVADSGDVVNGIVSDTAATFLSGAIGAVSIGFNYLLEEMARRPTSFDLFLQNTGEYFDHLIQDTSARENARYAGGKFTIELVSEEELSLLAEFYFLASDGNWTVSQRKGMISADCLKDWEYNTELMVLRGDGRLEYPIEAPN